MQPGPDHAPLAYHFDTRCVHAAQYPDPSTGAVIPSISLSTTFRQPTPGVAHSRYEYSRSGNPNRDSFESAVAALEGASYGAAFSSGSAATTTILHLIGRGAHVLSVNDVYGGTYRFFTRVAPTLDIKADFVELEDANELKRHLRPETKLVWLETPTNPTLRLVDIAHVSRILREHNPESPPLLCVDNTFLSPAFQNPLALGADLVVHSGTKYLNGHSDVVIGVVATMQESLAIQLHFLQNALGVVPSPFDCWLALRGLKTLHLRMRQHEQNAFAVARFLADHLHVQDVYYPGLESHPQYELAKRQQRGFGGMVTFRLRGDQLEDAKTVLSSLRVFTLAESLGGVESLAELPAVMTHASVAKEQREQLGIGDGLIRLSCGVEWHEDLVEDLKQALDHAFPPRRDVV